KARQQIDREVAARLLLAGLSDSHERCDLRQLLERFPDAGRGGEQRAVERDDSGPALCGQRRRRRERGYASHLDIVFATTEGGGGEGPPERAGGKGLRC